jgi:hypothetical protein
MPNEKTWVLRRQRNGCAPILSKLFFKGIFQRFVLLCIALSRDKQGKYYYFENKASVKLLPVQIWRYNKLILNKQHAE